MLTSSKIVGERHRRHKYFGFYDNAYNVPRVLLLLCWEVALEAGGQIQRRGDEPPAADPPAPQLPAGAGRDERLPAALDALRRHARRLPRRARRVRDVL